MSTSAAHHLSPAFPERAAWGTAPKLRAWQEGALAAYLERSAAGEKDFLTVATPGAGKTTYALQVATELLDRGLIREVTVVAPTEHLKHQWADAAARVGIHLNPAFANSVAVQSHEYGGVALTYAQVASRPDLHRQRTLARPTLVILDEIHHGGDAKSWGDAIREAFEPATRRLSLTGTPFRSDTSPIPFVRYEMDEQGILRSAADHSYGYAEALRDGVVRPVLFLAYGGAMRWRTKAGDEVAARLGEPMTKDAAAQAWRTALDPKGEWIPSVLRAADKRLTEVRRHVPDAGAMVIASNQTAARAYARHLETITGEKPTVVLSDDSGASTRIEEYAAGTSRWLVAVRMVSEGVDVPRLCVGVYATSTSTPLFFAQAVGRFVRARKRGETASVFLPSVPIILELAATMEAQRDHALDRPSSDESEASLWAEEEGLIAAANRTER
ncbi:DEAD/DEAH box helicase, partial [Phycicoccus sp.]